MQFKKPLRQDIFVVSIWYRLLQDLERRFSDRFDMQLLIGWMVYVRYPNGTEMRV